jgi:SAM-dependent methyltransferase
VERLKGALPAQGFLRETKRKLLGFHAHPGRDRGAIREGILQVQWVRAATPIAGARVLEIGSGWQPLIPILFSLAGAREVIMMDVERLCSPATLTASVNGLLLSRQTIVEGLGLAEETFNRRLNELVPGEPLDNNLARLGIRYMAPADARKTGLRDGAVDVVTSRATLEHIPLRIIREIFAESARILRPGGLMCHFVDCSDHWEHGDKRIARVNFLKFSDRAFDWIQGNGLNYQNRLRHPEYATLLREAGLRIVREERTVDPKSLSLLDSFPVAPRFRAFSKEDLATVDSYFLAVKPQD